MLKKNNELNQTLVIMGDFNYPTIKWPLTSNEAVSEYQPPVAREFLQVFKNTCLSQLVTDKTRFRDGQQPATLDLIITNEDTAFSKPTALSPIGSSDHIVLTTNLQLELTKQLTPSPRKKNYWRANFDAIKNELQQLFNTEEPSDNIDIDRHWQVLNTRIVSILNTNSPYRHIPTNRTKPWINKKILQLIRKKKRLWMKYKITKNHYGTYKDLRNHITNEIKFRRQKYEHNISKTKGKQLHSYIRKQISTAVSIPTSLLKDNGLATSNPREIAEIFADSFLSFYTAEPEDPLPRINSTPSEVYIEDVTFHATDITTLLRNLDPNSAAGPDGIPPILLKECANEITPTLTKIFRHSLDTGTIPTVCEKANITPIFKKGNKQDPNNYRPISITSVVCKILERLVANQILSFSLTTGCIPPQQHGFIPGRSITTNLLTCLRDWTYALDKGTPIDVIYLDFSKAFDKVPTRRLCYKLYHMGIRGKLLRWIEAFLTNRNYRVKIGDKLSTSRNIVSGVPQGSVLGPILFALYTSDLPQGMKTNFIMYADDTKFYSNPLTSKTELQRDLDAVSLWSAMWLIPLNDKKCTVMHIGRNNPRYQYDIGNTTLTSSAVIKDLGILITEDLKWETHIAYIAKKANRAIYRIRKAFVTLTSQAFSQLYKTYILPIVEFGTVIWNPYYVKDIDLIEGIQRRATRIPLDLAGLPYEQRLTKLGLTSLEKRRQRTDMVETFKLLNGWYNADVNGMFQRPLNPHLRGHSMKLAGSRSNINQYKNFLPNRVVDTWNTLPELVVSATSISSFKSRYDRLLTTPKN